MIIEFSHIIRVTIKETCIDKSIYVRGYLFVLTELRKSSLFMVFWYNFNNRGLAYGAFLFHEIIALFINLLVRERETAVDIFKIYVKQFVEYLYWIIHML